MTCIIAQFSILIKEVRDAAAVLGIHIQKPRTASRSQYRSNAAHWMTVWKTITELTYNIPMLDQVIADFHNIIAIHLCWPSCTVQQVTRDTELLNKYIFITICP